MLKWIILFAGIAANASASILIKVAMTPPRRFPSLLHPLEILQNWPLWPGLGLYGAAFLLYASSAGPPASACGASCTYGRGYSSRCSGIFLFLS